MNFSRPPDEVVATKCLPGRGAKSCAYLMHDGQGWACGKESERLVAQVRERLAIGVMTARGDNCSGPPNYEAKR